MQLRKRSVSNYNECTEDEYGDEDMAAFEPTRLNAFVQPFMPSGPKVLVHHFLSGQHNDQFGRVATRSAGELFLFVYAQSLSC